MSASYKWGSATKWLSTFSTASDEPLLRALNDPQKYVAAHALLADRYSALFNQWTWVDQNGSSIAVEFRRMRLHLQMKTSNLAPGKFWVVRIPDGAVTVDPGQLPTIRDMWRDALDRTFLTINIWWIAGFALVLIALQCANVFRQVKRLRSGRCVHCGYDLRANKERCPECGTRIPIARESALSSK